MPLVINSETIPRELLDEEFQLIKSHYEQMGAMSCCERDPEFREYARENVIARVLLNQEAEQRYANLDPAEISDTLNRLITEHGGPEEMCAKLGVASVDDPLLHQDIVSGLRMDKILNEVWGPQTAPSDEELIAYMKEHQSEYLTEERVRATSIFKQVEKVEERDAIYNKLRGLRREALNGADFEKLAVEHTDKEDKIVDLGWFKRGDFMDEFDLIFFSMNVGEVSPVFASHWGFHLAKITGHEEAVPKPFEEVKAEVVDRLLSERKQTKTKAFIEELKAKAVIE